MNRNFKWIQIFLVIAISLAIPVLSAYFRYSTLVEADFLSSSLSFENADQENLSFDYHNKSKVLGSVGFPLGFLPETNLFGQIFNFSFQKHSSDQKNLILRC